MFISTASVELVLSQISRAAHEERLALLAYWFMPDHLHLLIRGECEASDCKAFIKRAKQYSGFYYSKAFGQKLWQRYGHDHVLRDSERTGDVVRYILENPVKAGLCARADDYPFSGGYR